MLTLLLCYAIISVIFIAYGKSFAIAFDRLNHDHYDLFDHYFTGCCVAGTLLNAWSLFLPADQLSFFAVSIGSLLLVFLYRQHFYGLMKRSLQLLQNRKAFLILVLVAVIIVLGFAILSPKLYDSYLYHINAMQWNYLYHVVPGLANLHDRFGFNSSTAVIGATFSFIGFAGQFLFVINSLTFLVFFIWIIKHACYGAAAGRIFVLLFLYYFTAEYHEHISSPGTDLMPNIFVAYLLISLLLDRESSVRKSLLFVALPLFCLTFKLSIFPIAIVVLPAIYLRSRNAMHTFAALLGYGSLFILPWLVRNVILTGYLVYPIADLDLFSFDWEVSKSSITDIKKAIYSWARIPSAPYDTVMAMPLKEWFAVWWEAKLGYQQVIFVLASVSPLFIGFYAWRFRKMQNYTSVMLALCVSFCIFLLWFLTAPDLRFSYTVILVLAFCPVLFLEPVLPEIVARALKQDVFLFFAFIIVSLGTDSYLVVKDEFFKKKTSDYVYMPVDISTVKIKRAIPFTPRAYYTPENQKILFYEPARNYRQCFDKFPCTWYFTDFKLRGEDIQDGFFNAEH